MKQFQKEIQSIVKSKNSKEFWQKKLSKVSFKKILPYDYNSTLNYEEATIVTNLNKEILKKIIDISGNKNIVIYSIMIAALQIQMYRYGNRNSIINIPIYRKSKSNVSMNFELPLVSSIQDGMIIENIIDSCQNDILESYNNQYYSIKNFNDEHIQYNSQTCGQFSLSMTNIHSHYDIRQITETLKNHINIVIDKKEDKMLINAIYNSNLYRAEIIKNCFKNYIEILENSLYSINKSLDEIDLLTAQQKNKLLNEFNDTKTKYPRNKSVKELFEKQVDKSQDKIAIVANGKELSYKKLNKKANQIAHLLKKKGITNDSIVPIICDRSIETVISILGIIKSGGAYLPVDEDYPESRVTYMIKDSNSSIILGKKDLLNKYNLEELNVELVDIESDEISNESTEDLDNISSPKNLIYVIYTSGSTGKPKGVCVEHRNVVRLVKNSNFIEFKENDRILQTGSMAFDASTFEVWGALLNGLQLHIGSKNTFLDTKVLEDYLKENKITICWFTAALFNLLCKENINIFKPLRYLLTGGDVVSSKYVSRLKKIHKKLKVIDGYGPTENTTFSTIFTIEDEWSEYIQIPIGKPIANSTAYIIDKNNNLLPIGIPGELCLGGDGVARSYLNRDDLTKEKFIENPYAKGERIYKSGDLARWLPDGNIEFLGRVDNQVKIRGFRIELGEIESQLLKHNKVKEAVVIDRKDENDSKYLCGYVVLEHELSSKELKNFLNKELPDYMVPKHIIKLEEMPITSNGKIDKRILPQPNLSEFTDKYIAPRNEIEKKLSKIWTDALLVEKVGIQNNFFDLGGDSLTAITIVSNIHKDLNYKVQISDIFDKPVIAKLAKHIEEKNISYEEVSLTKYEIIEKVPEKEYYETSYVQKRMYAVNEIDTESVNYNIPFVYVLKKEFDINKFENIMKEIIKRHETLRTSFHVVDDEIYQRVNKEFEFYVDYEKIQGNLERVEEEVDSKIEKFISPFSLGKAPSIRAKVIELTDSNILILDIHHIICDGLSAEIIMREIRELFEGKKLNEVKVQYKDFSNWQNKLYENDVIEKEENYWLKRFEGEIPVLDIPTDFKRPLVQSFEGSVIKYKVKKDIEKKVNEILKKTGTTNYMFYLSIFNILLYKYSSQKEIIIGTPSVGRTHAELENTVGMFVNTLAMKNHLNDKMTFKEFLKDVKYNSIKAFENQNYDFHLLVDKLNISKNKNRNALFDVMFAVINFGEKSKLGNLQIKEYNFKYTTSKFDISLDIVRSDGDLSGIFEYNTTLFKKETIQKLISHFMKIINEVIYNLDIPIGEIELVSQEEKRTILHKFNDTDFEYPKEKTIQEFFEEQVKRTPNNIAITFKDTKLTYKELNEKANCLARLLREKGVTREKIVALMVKRSPYMIVGILGIIKAGGAYLPIDPDYPEDRKNYMIKNSNASILVTQNDLLVSINFEKEIIDIEDKSIYKLPNTNIENINTANDLIYLIYTSGTTGNPKGVMVEQRGVVNITKGWTKDYNLDEMEIRLLQTASFSFDFFTADLFKTLLNGGEMVLCPKEIKLDPIKLYELINKHKITFIESTPGLINILTDYVYENNLSMDSVEMIIVTADVCSIEDFNKLNARYGKQARIINCYGVTEATIDSSYFELMEGEKLTTSNVPIGKPMKNTKLYVLDNERNMIPIGVYGELYIGGDGVARGYFNNEELTKARYVDNPYKKGSKIYKTGDLARWLPDGNIELVGRIDSQVKVNGYRIELGEIENQILKNNKIKQAIAIVKKYNNDSNYIVAFIVGDEELTEEHIRADLHKKLPNYMIPRAIIKLDKMPLTPNDKVDKMKLNQMDVKVNDIQYIAPRSEYEKRLSDIWSDILKTKNISIREDFFRLGGNSLAAIRLIAKVHKEFKVKITVSDVFYKSTIEELAKYIEEKITNCIEIAATSYNSIMKAPKKDYYEASSVQKRIYALNQTNKESTNYNVSEVTIIKGKININKLKITFKKLIRRHESLRTSFHVIDGVIFQKVHKDFRTSFDHIKISDSFNNLGSIVNKRINEFTTPFELSKSPLIKAQIIELDDVSILILDMHHIISDGTSTAIIVKDLIELYEDKQLEEVRIQYKDFSYWQNKLYKEDSIETQIRYWINQFKDEIPVLNMPTDYPRSSIVNFEGDTIFFEISKDLSSKMESILEETGVTKYMLLLAVFNILLAKYSRQEDIVIGSPTSGRTNENLYNTVGMFVNSLPIRNAVNSEKCFREFLNEVRKNAIKVFENQDCDFGLLVERLDIKAGKNRNPLFDVMFTVQKFDPEIETQLEIEKYTTIGNTAKFDLTLAFSEGNKNFGIVEYRNKLFKKETIERFIKHYENILKNIVENLDIKIKDIEMIDEEEKKKLLYNFNDTKAEYPKDMTIQEIFEAKVKKNPDKVALVFENREITYRELNEYSNKIARKLRASGVKPNDLVTIMLDRSFEMIIGIMGILKSGGAYVPIDPSYPADRTEYMLNDSKANILITKVNTEIKGIDEDTLNGTTKTVFEGIDSDLIIIGLDDETINLGDNRKTDKIDNKLDNSNLEIVNKANDLAYIIYTSGSTGKPKGVMIEHKSAINTLYALENAYPVDENDGYLLKTAYTFDVSVTELFGWFVGNGKLVILKQGHQKDPNAIYETIKKNNVTHMNFAPSAFNMFINAVDKDSLRQLDKLKYVMVAGEAFSKDLADKCRHIFDGVENIHIKNIYGPTEATIYTSKFSLSDLGDKIYVPIGQPIDNIKTYVLDKDNNLAPIGVAGELCIAGIGVARGYLNRPELTEEKFVENPYNPEEKMYRSGDLVRWLPDGNIEFLGRFDHQVKIRGFRIELGEIESHLLKHNKVKEVVVIDRKDESDNKYLCGYVIAEGKITSKGLKDFLQSELPDYMVPRYIIQLNKIPVTKNGKVDRKNLPKLDLNELVDGYIEPRNNIERKLSEIWSDILYINKIGIEDDFFQLGGHSLKAITVVSKIHKELNCKIQVSDIFDNPTIEKLAKHIENISLSYKDLAVTSYEQIEKAPEKEYYEASSVQKRMYAVNQVNVNSTNYNMPFVYLVKGEFDRNKFELVMKKLITRHEALRTSFHIIDGKAYQKIHEKFEFDTEYQKIQGDFDDVKDKVDSIIDESINPFDLSKSPLIRAKIIELQDLYMLILDIHHIISDGLSVEIIIQEIKDLYEDKELNKVEIQYKDFSHWQNQLYENGIIKKQEKFWVEKLKDGLPVLNMPKNYTGNSLTDYEGNAITFEIDKEINEKIEHILKDTGTTKFMFFLAVYNILLSKYSGQEDILVVSPVVGRTHESLNSTVGMFVNTLPLINTVESFKSFIELLNEVKINSLHAFENQDCDLERIIEKLDTKKVSNKNLLFDVSFSIINTYKEKDEDRKLKLIDYEEKTNSAKFELMMGIYDYKIDNKVKGILGYKTSVYKKETIIRFIEGYKNILETVINNPNINIEKVNVLNEVEKNKIEHTIDINESELDEYNDLEFDF